MGWGLRDYARQAVQREVAMTAKSLRAGLFLASPFAVRTVSVWKVGESPARLS